MVLVELVVAAQGMGRAAGEVMEVSAMEGGVAVMVAEVTWGRDEVWGRRQRGGSGSGGGGRGNGEVVMVVSAMEPGVAAMMA